MWTKMVYVWMNPRMRSDRACAGTLGSHGHCSAVDGDWVLIWGYHGLIWGYHQDRTGHHGIHNQILFSVLVWFIWIFTGFQLVNYCKPPVLRRFNHQVQGFNWLIMAIGCVCKGWNHPQLSSIYGNFSEKDHQPWEFGLIYCQTHPDWEVTQF